METADLSVYSPNKVVVKTELEAPGILVLGDTWYPGWTAYDNGKETKIYRANYVLRGVYLGSGEHTVEFVYDPLSFKAGLAVTCLSTLILFSLAFRSRKLF